MNDFAEAIRFLLEPGNWSGTGGLLQLVLEQLWIVAIVIAVSSVIAIPLGYLIGHTGRGKNLAVVVSGAARALPTLGLLTLVALATGIGLLAPVVALTVLAVPSILAGAYSGLEAVDRRTVDASQAVGMTQWQVLTRVEIPLGLPLLIGGLRSAVLQVVATATLAAITGSGGVGGLIFRGLALQNYPYMIAGSIIIIVMALVLDGLLALAQGFAIPVGVRHAGSRGAGRRRSRTTTASVAAAEAPTPARAASSPS